ncbi:MAG: response regulator transcription factor [Roseburia sp.]|nr:response regulator transcription factor [Roseburia sp.]MCM1279611.1 response regulator transcription factor [Robinsoniella sp.]
MRILLIEDDEKLLQLLAFQLKKEGYEVDCCNNGGDAMYYISQNAHDIILLDRMLPEMDGLSILRKTRESGITIPVIMLTALGQLQDKIDGLDTGADDYLVKPFAFEELLARIRCIKRRPRKWEGNHVLTLGDISLSLEEKVLTGPENSCTLSKRECDLLEVFLANKNQTMPRMVLLSKVWGPDAEVEEGNLDNYIHFLRRRLKSVGSLLTLTTVRGVGYKLAE